MQYKGKELSEVTAPQVFNPPRWMLVCNSKDAEPCERPVVAIAVDGYGKTYAIASTDTGDIVR